MLRMEKKSKAMIVTCNYSFCINNEGGKCTLDEIKISNDGLCEGAFDRMKYAAARAHRNELDFKPTKCEQIKNRCQGICFLLI